MAWALTMLGFNGSFSAIFPKNAIKEAQQVTHLDE
jgi:hypothetical protein